MIRAPALLPALLVERNGVTHSVAVKAAAAPASIAFLGLRYRRSSEQTNGGWPIYREVQQ